MDRESFHYVKRLLVLHILQFLDWKFALQVTTNRAGVVPVAFGPQLVARLVDFETGSSYVST